jgi:hypothetical protein
MALETGIAEIFRYSFTIGAKGEGSLCDFGDGTLYVESLGFLGMA